MSDLLRFERKPHLPVKDLDKRLQKKMREMEAGIDISDTLKLFDMLAYKLKNNKEFVDLNQMLQHKYSNASTS